MLTEIYLMFFLNIFGQNTVLGNIDEKMRHWHCCV